MLKKIFIISLITLTSFGKGFFNYSQSVDILNYFDYLSLSYGSNQDGLYQNEWIKKFGQFSDEEKEMLKQFRELRAKYNKKDQEFDSFTLSFYKASSIDEALKNLSKVVTKKEVDTVVKLLRHFKQKASSFISESASFKGKAPELEKRLKKNGVLKAYQDVFKFFGFKKNFQAKIFFVWAPKSFNMEIVNLQNIILIKVNPLEDISIKLDDIESSKLLVNSLFSTLTKAQLENFKKILGTSCPADAYNVLTYVLGPMHAKYVVQKKSFDPYVSNFSDPKTNLLAISFHQLFEGQLASKMEFSGSFPNKLEYLCSLIK
ncbi:hypothetical protein [Bacteriovorax sp. Seq25_V]|uniref:hypothetical protein n=1 Tax=Bacteriovorax sp. Seq25_V TaxID=1201288 RepID=UPI00038A1155|nr:hypothetical protein [Bacteriovorax sp. Seq25_V]EQC43768.1 hypothetical protein M900_1143 [Bacteriovorax sp. Seq25_V]